MSDNPGGIIIPGSGRASVAPDRHPVWEHHAQRVTFVENVREPGVLAACLRGGRFVCRLPQGYDGLSQIHMMSNGQVIVWHPNQPTLVCDFTTGKVAKADIPQEFYFRDQRR